MRTFVYTDAEGKHAEAEGGNLDDMVLALAMAIKGMSSFPKSTKTTKTTAPPRAVISRAAGY